MGLKKLKHVQTEVWSVNAHPALHIMCCPLKKKSASSLARRLFVFDGFMTVRTC